MMKIERVSKTEANDPWYVRSELDLAWMDIYKVFEDDDMAFDYTTNWVRVPEPFENAGDYVEVPF
jgi:hypothetical protein